MSLPFPFQETFGLFFYPFIYFECPYVFIAALSLVQYFVFMSCFLAVISSWEWQAQPVITSFAPDLLQLGGKALKENSQPSAFSVQQGLRVVILLSVVALWLDGWFSQGLLFKQTVIQQGHVEDGDMKPGRWGQERGNIELEKEDSELVCSTFSPTTTSSMLLARSDLSQPPVSVGQPTVCFQSTHPSTYYEHLCCWILHAKEQTFTNTSDECIKPETERVEKSTGKKSTRGKGQVQNESAEEVKATLTFKWQQSLNSARQTGRPDRRSKKAGLQKKMISPIILDEMGLLPSEVHLLVSSSSLCLFQQTYRLNDNEISSDHVLSKSLIWLHKVRLDVWGKRPGEIFCRSGLPHFSVYIYIWKYSNRPFQLIIVFFHFPAPLQSPLNLNDKGKLMASFLLSY